MKARIRTSKPELWKHWLLWHLGEITQLPKLAHWYNGLWHYTDRESRFEWNPQRLKSELAPYDAVDFERVLNVLANGGFIVKYRVGVRLYGWIPRLSVHQSFNPREDGSVLPEPPHAALAFYEQQQLEVNFADLSADAATRMPFLIDDSVSASNSNDLQDGSRVSDASTESDDASVERPHAHSISFHTSNSALQREQNSEEQRIRTRANENGADVGVALVTRNAPALPAVRGKRDVASLRSRVAQVFAEVHEGSRKRISVEQLRKLNAELVFMYWAAKFDHTGALLDAKRERKIVERLKENGDNVSELLYALDGAYHDPWTMGTARDSSRKYDDIPTILRDRAQIERFAATRPAWKKDPDEPHKQLKQLEAALRGDGVVHEGEPK